MEPNSLSIKNLSLQSVLIVLGEIRTNYDHSSLVLFHPNGGVPDLVCHQKEQRSESSCL